MLWSKVLVLGGLIRFTNGRLILNSIWDYGKKVFGTHSFVSRVGSLANGEWKMNDFYVILLNAIEGIKIHARFRGTIPFHPLKAQEAMIMVTSVGKSGEMNSLELQIWLSERLCQRKNQQQGREIQTVNAKKKRASSHHKTKNKKKESKKQQQQN